MLAFRHVQSWSVLPLAVPWSFAVPLSTTFRHRPDPMPTMVPFRLKVHSWLVVPSHCQIWMAVPLVVP